MKKFLSITIPTYNRAAELDRQLAWLAQEIKGFEQECEVIVSDNCSTDYTPDVIEKWRSAFATTTYRPNRNSKNIFGVPNIALTINAAEGEFVWTIGDDDPIKVGTLAKVISLLRDNPDLAMLYLNFDGRDDRNNQAVEVAGLQNGQWLDAVFAATCPDGRAVFEHCVEQSFGSVIFVTAMIYRTQIAQESIQVWADSIHNWGGPGFWAGYCVTKGRLMITPETYIECKVGASHWQSEPDIWFRMFHHDIPEIFVKLQEHAGYSSKFCRRMILKNYKDTEIKVSDIKGHLRTAKKWPRFAASLLLLLLI
jgi:glycosyltransferase involved in cell wall biosynthesis